VVANNHKEHLSMPTVWFTKGLRNTVEAITMIRTDPLGAGVRLVGSHTDPGHAVLQAGHEGWAEPVDVDDETYPAWVLETAVARGVDLVVAQRRAGAFESWRARFQEAGVRLSVPATAMVLDRLDRKDLFSQDMEALGVPVAATQPFQDVASFDAAVARLSLDPRAQAHGLCFKPVRGIYGSGFRILREGDEFDRLMKIGNLEIDPVVFRSFLATTAQPRAMILMSLLPGMERSVDFVAHNGTFVAGVARRKEGRDQVLESEGPSIDIARKLASVYHLHGVCNVQTKEADGVPHVLEINPRMSGGFSMACLSGVKLPLWHVLLELGLAGVADVPRPRGDLRVTRRDVAEVITG
jgi:predicted ATP-grasp superfamily ATP-dependent carboligase